MLCAPSSTLLEPSPLFGTHQSSIVDISQLLKPVDEDDSRSSASQAAPSIRSLTPAAGAGAPNPASTPNVPSKRLAGSQTHPSESPAKKQSKWSPDEDAKIIQLRGEGLKWEDISKQLPGRSAISCRLHYQNYLERRSEWDEDRKNKLARLYERSVAKRRTRSCPTRMRLTF